MKRTFIRGKNTEKYSILKIIQEQIYHLNAFCYKLFAYIYFKKTWEVTIAKYKVVHLFFKKCKNKYVILMYFIIKPLSNVYKYICAK